jgi:hypothetical protein
MPQDLARKLRRAALVGAMGVGLVTGGGLGAAVAEDDDDDLLDVKILRHIMTGLGLKKPGTEQQIEYRERAPLVIPPSRDLPAPETTSSIARNPAWPADKEVQRNAEASAQRKKRQPVNWEEEARPLRPSQLGGTGTAASAGARQASVPARSAEEAMKPVQPSELGYKGGLFSFGSFFGLKKEEYAQFDREPARTGLTDPPPGYRTPSPDQPYGVGPSTETSKLPDAYDRPVGSVGTQR